MIEPPYLKTGDKIALIGTARKISLEEVQPAVKIIKANNLIPVFGINLFNEENQFSGTDEERIFDLQQALDDPSIKAIIIARGGYGTLRIIDKIDFTTFKKHPKWIIGYSDITVLHSHIHNFGIATLHATMPINFQKNSEATESLFKTITGKKIHYQFPAHKLNRTGKTEGVVVGGNLSLLYALIGSISDIDTTGKILFIEDLDEYLYHIDRMMLNLKRAGKLKGLKGLIVGGMTEMKDNTIPFGKSAEEIILDAVAEYDFPVAFNFPAGHVDQNLAVTLGISYQLLISSSESRILSK